MLSLNPDGVTKRRKTRSESCGFSFLEPSKARLRRAPKKKSAARMCNGFFVSEFGAQGARSSPDGVTDNQ